MLFWDAHGYEIANTVFARILPILKGREVLVVCRDMLDNQYSNTSYDGRPIWVRQEQQLPLPAVHLGTVYSNFEQVVPIVDFCSRNRLPFHSATHSLAKVPELRDVLGAEEGWPGCYWHYFATDGSGITYPSPRSMSGNPENNSPRINFASSLDGRLTEASEKVQKLQGAVATMTGRLEAVEAAYDNVREQLDALTKRIQNWLLPTLAKHSAAIRRRRNWLSPVGDWSRAGGRRRQTSPSNT